MTPRIDNAFALAPDAIKAMYALEGAIKHSGLDETLLHLVKTRASQINHCAFCIQMHTKEARAHGETELRLYMLNAWRESPLYSARERAALAWTEALTTLDHKTDYASLRGRLRASFTDKEIGTLTANIGMINLWNRIQVSAH